MSFLTRDGIHVFHNLSKTPQNETKIYFDTYYTKKSSKFSREPSTSTEETTSSQRAGKNKKISNLKKYVSGKFFNDFCNETSIHGFNHIVAPKRHIFEKIGWAVATLLAALGAVQLCLQQWQRYVASPTVVALEKDYRTWNNSFLALTACLTVRTDPSAATKVIDRIWEVHETDEKFGYYMNFVETVSNATLLSLEHFEQYVNEPDFQDVDLFKLAMDVAVPYKPLVAWFDRTINVSFVEVMTERGICHTINSVVSSDQATKITKSAVSVAVQSCQYITHPCYMRVELYTYCAHYYPHSPYDLLDMSVEPMPHICPGQDINTDWKVMETKASADVKALAVDQRRCRFHDEPSNRDRKVYSSSACRRDCRNKIALKLCGCRPFFYFQEGGPVCGVAGMACLARQRSDLLKLKGCSCLPQCVDSTYELTSMKESRWTGPFAERSSIKVGILPPRSRYRRQILFCFEDLVVSFGGAAGLFLGCSFLSGVEIVYFILERCASLFCTSRKSQIQPEDNRRQANPPLEKPRGDAPAKHALHNYIGRIAEFE